MQSPPPVDPKPDSFLCVLPQEISFFFLEPYRSSACTSYSSCLGCLADQGCGWCLNSATCHLRQGGAHCEDDGTGESLLVLVPALCPLCEEHRDCHACTQVSAGIGSLRGGADSRGVLVRADGGE